MATEEILLKEPTIRQVYRFFADAVKFAPPVLEGPEGKDLIKCKRPQTFAVLPDASAERLTSDNLGKIFKDENLPYFYSRKWEGLGFDPGRVEWEYPAVFMFETSAPISNPFGRNQTNRRIDQFYNFQIYCVDKFDEKCCGNVDEGYCKSRTPDDIKLDCENILKELTFYISQIGYYKIQLLQEDGGGEKWAWENSEIVKEMCNLQFVESAVIDETETRHFQKMLQGANITNQTGVVENFTNQCLWGRWIQIAINVPYCNFNYTPKFNKKQIERIKTRICC